MGDFIEITEKDFETIVAKTQEGLVIFYKKLCPHCKNMEKVLLKFSAKNENIAILRINQEENPEACRIAGVERCPTIVIIKQGAISSSKPGLMNPKELILFYQNA